MGPNSDVLENSTFFSKPVGSISHVFVGPNSYNSGGTRHVPPTNHDIEKQYVVELNFLITFGQKIPKNFLMDLIRNCP